MQSEFGPAAVIRWRLGTARGTYEADVQCEALELRDGAGVKDQLTDREPARRIVSVRRRSRPGNS